MRYPSLLTALGTAISFAMLSGCGVARQLTTQHKTYSYTVSLPPMPANTESNSQFAIDANVRDTYHKYHGGVDWTKLAYQASNGSTLQPATFKTYVSLTSGIAANQLDQQATLIDTIDLAAGENRTVTLAQAANNDVLKSFLANALSQNQVDNIYVYVATASTDATAMVTVQNYTFQVGVHGSYF
jgi:hypothetical protein